MALFDTKNNLNTIYTTKVGIPQYLPKGEKPLIESIYDDSKYKELLRDINESTTITEEEREFLKLAATRHIKFNYSMIADYYAHSDKEMQRLMEKSALVIIDINDAIANGYAILSKKVDSIINNDEDSDEG